VAGKGDGGVEVVHPAYIDSASQRTILAGRARRTAGRPVPLADETS
jgi:hypothetical protein